MEFAPHTAGSDVRFLRYVGQAYHFRPWHGVVLASAARLGLVTPLGGQSPIPSERFFGGGARTVRGIVEDGLGPRVLGQPVGGRALFVANQEVRFPVHRRVKGVGFSDAGQVFAAPADFDLAHLTVSFGAGLRVATPFALLRVDYGRLWSPRADQLPGRWTFGIGHAF